VPNVEKLTPIRACMPTGSSSTTTTKYSHQKLSLTFPRPAIRRGATPLPIRAVLVQRHRIVERPRCHRDHPLADRRHKPLQRGAQIERFADLALDHGDPRYLEESSLYWQMAQNASDVHKRNTEQFRNRPRRQRPKVPTICARPISVAQILADTANPARTLGVL
jgi:hypothetical protein